MKILHIAPNAPYNYGWGYQENLLPKYHKRLGHDVTLIITNTMHKDGKIVETDCADYISKDGVRIIRLTKRKYFSKILTNLRSKMDVMPYLNEIQPDFVFFHGLISTTIFDVIKYKKKINPDCVIVQDNHLDYNIGKNKNLIFKDKIIRGYYRRLNRKTIKHIACVYGVTPWRKQYAEEYFKIPATKTDVLLMGADDDEMNIKSRDDIRYKLRQQYDIGENTFLVISGGKIDKKKNIHLLIEACKDLNGVKLMIFGQIDNEIVHEVEKDIDNKKIIYLGWLNSSEIYKYFYAADLAFFPGQHSVLWEQACASKIPCVFKSWEGMYHVNNGGNSDFINNVSVVNIKEKISELFFTPKYFNMKKVADSKATDIYLYSNIAKKSLEKVSK